MTKELKQVILSDKNSKEILIPEGYNYVKLGIQLPFCGEPVRLPWFKDNNSEKDIVLTNKIDIDKEKNIGVKINGSEYYLNNKNTLEYDVQKISTLTLQLFDEYENKKIVIIDLLFCN